jgi:hypothetical protein
MGAGEGPHLVGAALVNEVFILKAVALHSVLKCHCDPPFTTPRVNTILTRGSPSLHIAALVTRLAQGTAIGLADDNARLTEETCNADYAFLAQQSRFLRRGTAGAGGAEATTPPMP